MTGVGSFNQEMGKTEWEVQWWRDMKAQQEALSKKAAIEKERGSTAQPFLGHPTSQPISIPSLVPTWFKSWKFNKLWCIYLSVLQKKQLVRWSKKWRILGLENDEVITMGSRERSCSTCSAFWSLEPSWSSCRDCWAWDERSFEVGNFLAPNKCPKLEIAKKLSPWGFGSYFGLGRCWTQEVTSTYNFNQPSSWIFPPEFCLKVDLGEAALLLEGGRKSVIFCPTKNRTIFLGKETPADLDVLRSTDWSPVEMRFWEFLPFLMFTSFIFWASLKVSRFRSSRSLHSAPRLAGATPRWRKFWLSFCCFLGGFWKMGGLEVGKENLPKSWTVPEVGKKTFGSFGSDLGSNEPRIGRFGRVCFGGQRLGGTPLRTVRGLKLTDGRPTKRLEHGIFLFFFPKKLGTAQKGWSSEKKQWNSIFFIRKFKVKVPKIFRALVRFECEFWIV